MGILDHLDKNKVYKLSFKKGVTFHPLSWLGGLIRLIARVKYNHVGVLYYRDVWYLQEAIDKGVISEPFVNSNAYHYYSHYSIEESPTKQACIMRIREIEGKKYDYKGLLFYQLWLNLFNKWIGKAAKDGDKYYCYEAVATVFDIREKKPTEINSHFITIYEGRI
jgi:hypothetical protein